MWCCAVLCCSVLFARCDVQTCACCKNPLPRGQPQQPHCTRRAERQHSVHTHYITCVALPLSKREARSPHANIRSDSKNDELFSCNPITALMARMGESALQTGSAWRAVSGSEAHSVLYHLGFPASKGYKIIYTILSL